MVNSPLMRQFHQLTQGKYDFLHLSEVSVNLAINRAAYVLIYPEERESQVISDKAYITEQLRSIIEVPPNTIPAVISFRKSHFDPTLALDKFLGVLRGIPAIACAVSADHVLVSQSRPYVFTLVLASTLADYVRTGGILDSLREWIYLNYCEPVDIVIDEYHVDPAEHLEQLLEHGQSTLVLDDPASGRKITPTLVERFIGSEIPDPAFYLADAKSPRQQIILCGTIEDFAELTTRRKPDQTEDRFYFRFVLRDFTDSVGVVYFPSKRTLPLMRKLANGTQIICRGELKLDTYRGDGSMTFFPRDISYCQMPTDFVYNRARVTVPAVYTTVVPVPFVQRVQSSLVDTTAHLVPPQLLSTRYCVFDVETTGKTNNDRITELGAVLVVDGVITHTFQSLVDPQMPISSFASELCGLTDADLAGQPTIDLVLKDFLKFCDGCVLVGHNVAFDIEHIRRQGAVHNIYFDNMRDDTFHMARRLLPELGKYTLGDLATHFGVVNTRPHRALPDALATAEIFVHLHRLIASSTPTATKK